MLLETHARSSTAPILLRDRLKFQPMGKTCGRRFLIDMESKDKVKARKKVREDEFGKKGGMARGYQGPVA